MQRRINSLDKGYIQGSLSVFPQAIDSHFTLFEANNNLETTLSHKLTTTAKYIIVEDASGFPQSGMLRISPKNGTTTPEVLYYGRKIGNQFHILQRNHAGSWDAGTVISCPVMAEHQDRKSVV